MAVGLLSVPLSTAEAAIEERGPPGGWGRRHGLVLEVLGGVAAIPDSARAGPTP
jgi:hypothetical protein